MREKIITAFWTLAEKRNIHKIIVKEICYEAGCSRMTFYRHFEYVENILNQAEKEIMDSFINKREDLKTTLVTGEKEYKMIIMHFKEHIRQLQILLGPNGSESFSKDFRAFLKPILVENILESRDISREEAEFLACYIISATLSMFVSDWQKDYDFEAFMNKIIKINHHLVVTYQKSED